MTVTIFAASDEVADEQASVLNSWAPADYASLGVALERVVAAAVVTVGVVPALPALPPSVPFDPTTPTLPPLTPPALPPTAENAGTQPLQWWVAISALAAGLVFICVVAILLRRCHGRGARLPKVPRASRGSRTHIKSRQTSASSRPKPLPGYSRTLATTQMV